MRDAFGGASTALVVNYTNDQGDTLQGDNLPPLTNQVNGAIVVWSNVDTVPSTPFRRELDEPVGNGGEAREKRRVLRLD